MEKQKREVREIIPSTGIWSIRDFADFFGLQAPIVIEILSNHGVKIFHFGKFYNKKLFRLEDLGKKD